MNQYMIEIKMVSISLEKVKELAGPEDAKVAEMMKAGIVKHGYVRADLSGAYMVIVAEDEDDVRAQLSTLPMYEYMQLAIVPIRDMV